MKALRSILAVLTVLAAGAAALIVASPAHAAVPSLCTSEGYTGGRAVVTDNANNGHGAYLEAKLCWKHAFDGFYKVMVSYTVQDTAPNDAGATPRIEYTGASGDGGTDYWVPHPDHRAWTFWEKVSYTFEYGYIKDLYIRACLTNTDSPAHHCGPKA